MTEPMTEEEQLTVVQLTCLIKWVKHLRDTGYDVDGVIGRLEEWRAEMGLPEGPIKFIDSSLYTKPPKGAG